MIAGWMLGLALLQGVGARAQDSAATAYQDGAAREMVRLARERRRLVDRSVERYEAVARERISLGLRALRRERLFYRRETATRIDWTRDGPIHMEVLAAREVIPVALPRAQVPADLEDYVPHLAIDPADNRMLLGWGDNNFVRHPLAPGSEAHYRFRSGDTTVIALPQGQRIRLRELQIIPRRRDVHLIRGSFWLDAETHAVVQAGFRLADDFDLDRDGDEDDTDDVPGILKPIRARVQYVTIEYGLWDLKWWLPRVIAFEGSASIGRLLSAPLLYERVYSGYRVTGSAEPVPPIAFEADSTRRAEQRLRCRSRMRVSVRAGGGEMRAQNRRGRAAGDSVRADQRRSEQGPEQDSAAFDPCDRYVVTVSADTVSLLTSPLLPPDPYTAGVAMVSKQEIQDLSDRLQDAAPVPWQISPPLLQWGLGGYNRVEGLWLGARGELDFGRLRAAGALRLGVADLHPNAELSLSRETFSVQHDLTGYRRLESMEPAARPFSFWSSFSALMLGRDETDYFRTLGVELRGRPVEARPQWYEWRVYAQQERAASKETDFSLRHLLDDTWLFPENAQADRADQYGAALTLRADHGYDPLGLRVGAELGVDAATGTFDYVRPALTLRSAVPLPRRYVVALEASAGSTFGKGGVQHLWRLGGPQTLRGYPGSVATGESYWRARFEVANQFPAARLVLFSDAGWAGQTDDWRSARPLLSAGVGASLLDGILRIDLARATRPPTGWRLHLYIDGRL